MLGSPEKIVLFYGLQKFPFFGTVKIPSSFYVKSPLHTLYACVKASKNSLRAVQPLQNRSIPTVTLRGLVHPQNRRSRVERCQDSLYEQIWLEICSKTPV